MVSLLVTVTVEGDRQRGRAQATTHNLEGVLALHEVAAAAGARPTYLVTHPITQRERAAPLLRFEADGACEIGACFQPSATPPFDYIDALSERHEALPPQVISDKLVHLTDAVSAWRGARPRAFRASHARQTGHVLRVIERLGYRASSSVSPFLERPRGWGEAWRQAPEVPYFPERQAPLQRGSSPILEIPRTRGFPTRASGLILRAQRRLPRALARRLPRVIALDPTRYTRADLEALARVSVARGLPVLNVSLASAALWRGVEPTLRALEGLLRFALEELEATPLTMSGFCDHYLDLALGGAQPPR